MLGLTHFDMHYFNCQFLKFRTQYYFNETNELLSRHKLLTAFIICLLAPGVRNIKAIGIPFYTLIDPLSTLKIKLIYLVPLLLFLLAMTKAQVSFIKGGAFREYLHTLNIPSWVHKSIDLIILLYSFNIVWLAIFFGGASILHHSDGRLFTFSQYCLYISSVFLLCTLLLSFLYKKMIHGIVLFFALVFIAYISTRANWLLNYSLSIGIFLLSGGILWLINPVHIKQTITLKMPIFNALHGFNSWGSLKNKFVIQVAVFRKNKLSFCIRFALCLALTFVILQIILAAETGNERPGLILILIGFQTYILSTLFTLFEKEKLDHSLFHKIFPYQKHTQLIKEILLVWGGLMLALSPVALFNLKNYCALILVIVAMNGVAFTINRILYAQSLRFCLFSSLLNTVGCCVIQYFVLGA